MKLSFDKKDSGEVFVQVEGRNFATKDYIEMIKQIKKNEEVEAEFTESITQDERNSIEAMLGEINGIKDSEEEPDEEGDEFDF